MIILLLYRFRIVLSVELSCAVSKKCSLMRLLNDCKFFFFFAKITATQHMFTTYN